MNRDHSSGPEGSQTAKSRGEKTGTREFIRDLNRPAKIRRIVIGLAFSLWGCSFASSDSSLKETTGFFPAFEQMAGHIRKQTAVVLEKKVEEIQNGFQKRTNLAYGSDRKSQKLDLYVPLDGQEIHPLVLFIHGGSWMSGSKEDSQHEPWLHLIRHGFALASVDYTLSLEKAWPAGFQDCQQALVYLRDHAREYGLDLDHMAVAGDSSGGHYALMMALDPGSAPWLKACVAWYPVTDLNGLLESYASLPPGQVQEVVVSSMKQCLELLFPGASWQDWQRISPVACIQEGMVPILLQHGTADGIVDASQPVTFWSQAQAMGQKQVELELFEQAGHCDPVFESEENMTHIAAFLQEAMAWSKEES